MTSPRPLRVCYVCSEYPPGPHGGIGTCTQLLARALSLAGHQVRVVGVYPADYPAPSRALDGGVQVLRLREATHPGAWVRARARLFGVVSAWAARNEIDVVEVPDWEGWAAHWSALPIPVVVRLNGSATFFAAELGHSVRRLTRWLERRSLQRADRWCSSSRYTAERTWRLLGASRSDGAVLPNPVEFPPGVAIRVRRNARVVFTGTLTLKKGVVALLDAWPRVLMARGDAELHVYGKDGRAPGGGSMRAWLLDRLSPEVKASVHFHGHVSRTRLFETLASARTAVFPSFAEAFGIAPLEAMAWGCPTIYTRRGPGPELMRADEEALLVDPADPVEIANAVLRILQDDQLAIRLARAGRDRVQQDYAIDRLAPSNVTFYRSAITAFHQRHAARPRAASRPHGSGPLPGSAGRGTPVGESDRAAQEDGLVAIALSKVSGGRHGQCAPERSQAGRPDTCLSPGVTVVIVTYRRAEALARFLESLSQQDLRPQELVVVDASPDDATERMLAAWPLPHLLGESVRYFRVAAPHTGTTRQRNFGLQHVRTDLVAFFDDDIVLLPGCLAELARAHRAAGSDVVGVAAYIDNEHSKPLRTWRLRHFLRMVPSLEPGRYYRCGISTPWGFLPPTGELVRGDWLPAGATMWKTQVARELGFSPVFEGYGTGEDLEFSLRIGKRGALLVAGAAHVLHLHAAAGRPDPRVQGHMLMRNHHFIHATAFGPPPLRERLWFAYAWLMETAIQSLNLLRPQHRRDSWEFLRGAGQFWLEWMRGRPHPAVTHAHGVGTEGTA